MTAARCLRADPAGNVTLLVLSPVEAADRPRAAVELLRRYGGEQAGFLAAPRLGGLARLEMMGGEFCGNALRCLGLWYVRSHPELAGRAVPMEISGCGHPLAVTADPVTGTVSARMPLPLALETWHDLPTAVLPGIVHALCAEAPADEARARALTRALVRDYAAPAAGVMFLSGDRMRPAVYVAETDTLYFESSCASGSAAAAALLSAREKKSARYLLAQPGGDIAARAQWEAGVLTALTISGQVAMGEPFDAEWN